MGCTENGRSAGPCPVAGAPNVSQSDSALAVHWHSLSVATLIVPDPPDDATLDVLTFKVTPHRDVERAVGVRSVVDEEPQPVDHVMRMSRSTEE